MYSVNLIAACPRGQRSPLLAGYLRVLASLPAFPRKFLVEAMRFQLYVKHDTYPRFI